jgi:hypothetical protein
MIDSLQINTGEKRIPIVRDGESVGEIVFNPSDVVWVERFYKIVSEFQITLTDYQTRYKALEKDKDGKPVQVDVSLALLHDACTYVREKIDYVFGSGTSQLVFGDAMVIEVFPQFFDGITPHIKTVRAEKIEKYTGKQRKRVLK